MKIHKKTFANVEHMNGGQTESVSVEAWNDSGVEWGVTCNGHTHYYSQRKWTMRGAMMLSAQFWGQA